MGPSTTNDHRDEGASILEARDLTKAFGGIQALHDVSLSIPVGQVTALVGENGAGKSTLIKCLSGVHKPDAGDILVDGQSVEFASPSEARGAGIETVHQDLALAENLDVSSNIFLGRELRHGWHRGFALKKREMHAQSNKMLKNFGIRLPSVKAKLRNLSGGQRQGVSIARATGWGTRLIVMDEPTAALGVNETQRVLEIITELAQKQLGVLVVSHSLNDVFEVSDRIWVLRQGKLVASPATRDTSHEEIIQYITGLAAANDEEEA